MEPPVLPASSSSPNSLQYLYDDNHKFIVPSKEVKTINDMNKWENSQAQAEIVGFIISLNNAVKGKSLKADCEKSEITQNIAVLLETLRDKIREFPPIDQPSRFGNAAFKQWFAHITTITQGLLENALPAIYHKAILEIKVYLDESFGNAIRIDYGTGHETSFIMFLYCFYKIGALKQNDKIATVCVLFNKYLELVRSLQVTYRMEPAGSHGVWSLDDFQFIPFIWGSSQLVAHPVIEPQKFLDEDILNKYGKDYMFLTCIEYILQVKTGPFAEHSNQLWGISAVPNWTKINQGLIKMYKNEVLGKFPVVQHIQFGSLLPIHPLKKN